MYTPPGTMPVPATTSVPLCDQVPVCAIALLLLVTARAESSAVAVPVKPEMVMLPVNPVFGSSRIEMVLSTPAHVHARTHRHWRVRICARKTY